MTYQTTAYCIEDNCKCLDSRGIILYRGDSRDEAIAAGDKAPAGYRVAIETIYT